MNRRKNDAYFTPENISLAYVTKMLQHSRSYDILQEINQKMLADYGGAIALDKIEYVLYIEPCAGAGHLTDALGQIMVSLNIWPYNCVIVSLDIDPQFEDCGEADFNDFVPSVEYILALHESGKLTLSPHQEEVLRNFKCKWIHVLTNPPYQIQYQDRWNGLGYRASSKKIKQDDQTVTLPATVNVMARINELIDMKLSNVEMSYLLRVTQLEPVATNIKPLKTLATNIVLPRLSFTGDGSTDSATTAWFHWLPNHEAPCQTFIYSKDEL